MPNSGSEIRAHGGLKGDRLPAIPAKRLPSDEKQSDRADPLGCRFPWPDRTRRPPDRAVGLPPKRAVGRGGRFMNEIERLSDADFVLCLRYLEDELDEPECFRFEARLADEADLAQGLRCAAALGDLQDEAHRAGKPSDGSAPPGPLLAAR